MSVINFSGLASGIDTESMITATSNATRSQREKPKQTKVTELGDTDTSLADLKTRFSTLQTALVKFATYKGGGVVKQGTSSDETKVSATATNGALNASYTVTVTSTAKNGTLSLAPAVGTYATSDAAISAGTQEIFTIGTGSAQETVTVPITAGSTTISQFVTTFNTLSSKATASLVNIGTSTSPSYKVVITSDATGTTDGAIAVTTNAAGFGTPTSSAATDAVFTIAGIGSITRSSNSISDIIAGVTIDIQSAGTATISVGDDITATESLVQDWVTAWNDIVTFVAENNQVTTQQSGTATTNTFAPLSNTRVDDNALTSLRSALSGTTYKTVNSSGTQTNRIATFPDLGITSQRDGTLLFNVDTFKTAITSEPLSVSNLMTSLADKIAISSGTIDQYIGFNQMFDLTINGNKTQITALNTQIADIEKTILQNETTMRQRFAALESNISKLQSQQSSLTSALAGLG